jgi:hypothetical protein
MDRVRAMVDANKKPFQKKRRIFCSTAVKQATPSG